MNLKIVFDKIMADTFPNVILKFDLHIQED